MKETLNLCFLALLYICYVLTVGNSTQKTVYFYNEKLNYLYSASYIVFPDAQMVVYKSGNGLVDKYSNCAVADVENWRCGSTKAMLNGTFVDLQDTETLTIPYITYVFKKARVYLNGK